MVASAVVLNSTYQKGSQFLIGRLWFYGRAPLTFMGDGCAANML